MKYTIYIVAPLDHGGDHGPNMYSLFPRNTNDADTPVSSGRRPFSALGKFRAQRAQKIPEPTTKKGGGRSAKKNECDLAL